MYTCVCIVLHFLYPFSYSSVTPGLFTYLAYVKNVAVNVGLHTSLQDSDFISFRYIPNSGIAGFNGSPIFNSLGEYPFHFS